MRGWGRKQKLAFEPMPRRRSDGPSAKARAADSGFRDSPGQGNDAGLPTAASATFVEGVPAPRIAFAPGTVEAWQLGHFYRFHELPQAWQAQPDNAQARGAASSLGRSVQDIRAYPCLSLPDMACCWVCHEAWKRFVVAEGQEVPENSALLPIMVESAAVWRQAYGDDKFRELRRYFATGARGKPPGNWAVLWAGPQ